MAQTETIFYNADYLVIEYLDFIKSPYFVLLQYIQKNEKLRPILRLEEIESFDLASLYEWYVNRKHQNFLIDLNRDPEKVSEEFLDGLIMDQMLISEKFYSNCNLLCTQYMLRFLKSKKYPVKDVLVYCPFKTPWPKEDLKRELGIDFTFMDDFDEVCKKAGANSTYFLSNIDLIHRMEENKVLHLSSIVLPIEYRYNKKNMKDYKIDFTELWKKYAFKLAYARACSTDEHDNGSIDTINRNTYRDPVE